MSGANRRALKKTWHAMLRRCMNPKARDYSRYGGAGIAVCDRWKSFEAFAQDMGPRPQGTTLDRIDNSRGYEPGNCRWATLVEQGRNRSCNRLLTYCGETLCLSAWAERTGLTRTTITSRIDVGGWSVERALTTPAELATACKRGHALTPENLYLYRNRRICRTCARQAAARSKAVVTLEARP